MTAHTRLIASLCEVYRAAARAHEGRNLSVASVSRRVFDGDNKKLGLILAGRDLETGTAERALLWLHQNWPPGHDAPEVLQTAVQSPAVWAHLAETSAEVVRRLSGEPSLVLTPAPSRRRHKRNANVARVRELASAGFSRAQTAAELGISYSHVVNLSLLHGITFREVRRGRSPRAKAETGEVA